MNESYKDGLKADLKKHCLSIAKQIEMQAIDSLDTEPDIDRVVDMAEKLEAYVDDE